jgi:nucleoid-associated protein YgaU
VKTPSAAGKLKGLEEKLGPSPRTGGEERQARSKRRLELKPGEKTRTHVVEQFDTFSELSAKYYGTHRYATLLWKANPQVPDARRLKLGMALRIPPLGELTGSGGAKAKASKSHDAKPELAKRADKVKVYVVKPNDSFYAIAEKVWGSGARWKELLTLNKDICPSPERLKPGMKLRLEAPKPKPRAKKPARSATPTTRARPKAKRSKESKPVG